MEIFPNLPTEMTSRSPTKIISGSPNKGVLWFSNWTEHILFTLCIAKVEKKHNSLENMIQGQPRIGKGQTTYNRGLVTHCLDTIYFCFACLFDFRYSLSLVIGFRIPRMTRGQISCTIELHRDLISKVHSEW